jgi:peptidyl-prolyl cis-trans isomerase D
MLAKLKDGATLAQVASENNLTVQKLTDLQRNQAKPPLSAAAVADVFRTANGAAGTVEGDQPATRLVFVVTDVVDPKLDAQSSEAKQLAETLGRGYSEDMIAEYVSKLENELGVQINQSALQQIVGGGRGDN